MAISSNSKVSWSDIQTIFTNLNNARKKFFPSQNDFVASPGGSQSQALAQLVKNLNTYIESFSSNAYIGSRANIDENPPSAGDLINPIIFDRFTTTIRTINDTCVHDSTYRSSYRSAYDSSDRGSYRSSYDSSYNNSAKTSNYSSFRSIYDASQNNTHT